MKKKMCLNCYISTEKNEIIAINENNSRSSAIIQSMNDLTTNSGIQIKIDYVLDNSAPHPKMDKNTACSPLKTLLNKPFSISSPPYSPYIASKRMNISGQSQPQQQQQMHHTPQATPPQYSFVAQSPMPTEPQDIANLIKIQNCVATVNLGCDLNLQKINFRTRNSEYNPSRFHGVIMRIRDPRCTALIFRSGKVVCTGARNELDANLGTRKFARILQKLGFPVKFTEFKIQNLVATVDLRFPIRLESLNQMHGQFSSYEPELFPGLIYRMVKPRVVLLIFVNGKIVFTGAKSKAEINESLENIYPILQSFRKN